MCGIAAIVPTAYKKGIDPGVLETMLTAMKHRGPDGTGTWVDYSVALGMTRLAIVGGESGQQPIWNENRTIAVVCNGEIYNYKSLKSELAGSGHQFKTRSDVEVIVHLYEEHREQCVDYLDGIYAFALWDSERQLLFCTRDRLGVKPLYYAKTKSSYVFASEIQALLAHPDVDLKLDPQGLAMYHTFRFVPAAGTVVEGVFKVPPAHYVRVQGENMSLRRYWSPVQRLDVPRIRPVVSTQRTAPNVTNGSVVVGDTAIDRNSHLHLSRPPQREDSEETRAAKWIQTLLRDAVTSQLASEVKSGVLLSGGLDSSILVALQKEASDQRVHTYTVAFEPPRGHARVHEYTEIHEAAHVAKRFDTVHLAESYTAKQVLEALPQIVRNLDEPIADPTSIPLWFATRLAHDSGCKVVFSGEGLDELFNGYSVYRQVYWNQGLRRLPFSLRVLGLKVFQRFGLPGQGALRRSIQPLWVWYQGIGGVFSESERAALFRSPYASIATQLNPHEYARRLLSAVEERSMLSQMTYFDVMAWLPDNTLAKSDKIAMAHSIELRVPFLDSALVEEAFKLRDRDKLRGGVGKWMVRQAMAGILPHAALNRRKAGFPVPISAWIYADWRDFAMSVLLDPNAYTRGLYERQAVEEMFAVPQAHQRRTARLLWTLLTLELWYAQADRAGKSQNLSEKYRNNGLNMSEVWRVK
ncbi:asparagine synthase (glutamine-hydrolyzing) [Alicyclobacillus tolerans]|uniref:asparagine synthase (glutamine-hydrolyzing) n=1 Tax=Alicyclobacillus tolerans TaxID=90970 RepID=UPI001F0091AD|nr:asparagine synthase (glutamine-hydrolyzing) [Alicyclobacillus tolerans]MCF8563512.1 asparagine synthase (glutamine-hydrolyzing) [Alicyclobacillus tolerans]